MAARSTTCPYCNALTPLPEDGGTRIECSRCGETFVADGQPAAAPAEPAANSAQTPEAVIPPNPARLSNGAVAGIIVGVMISMGALGLVFALATMPDRIANHQGITKPETTSVPLFLKLLAFAWILGLVYLLHGIWQGIRNTAQADWYRGVIIVIGVQAVLAVMLVALWSRNRGSQPRTPLPVELEDVGRLAVKPVPPAELSGLAFLPAHTNVAAGIRLAGLEPGQLERTLRAFWPAEKQIPFDLAQVEQWTGLHPDELDHVVIGATVKNELPPPFVVVAVTRRPVDSTRVIEKLKAQPLPGETGRYRFRIKQPALEAVLWCLPDRQTFLMALGEKDLAGISSRSAGDRLSPPLRGLLTERMGQHTWAWLIATDLEPIAGVDLPFGRWKTAGLWIEPLVEPSLHGAIQSSDAKELDTLATKAHRRFPECKTLRKADWLLLQLSSRRASD
ncbi:MAG: hypothetical protein AB7K24_00560 [Gemmataceae bacterium]